MPGSLTSREQVHVHRFPLLVLIGVPLLSVFAQAYIPRYVRAFSILDLPLLVTIYFAAARHEPIGGLLTGGIIGIVQDGLTQQPIGLYGIAKTIVGYAASSLGVRLDAESSYFRVAMAFVFYWVHQAIYLLVGRGLAGLPLEFRWTSLAIAAVVNAAVALPLFLLLDRFKRPT